MLGEYSTPKAGFLHQESGGDLRIGVQLTGSSFVPQRRNVKFPWCHKDEMSNFREKIDMATYPIY